MKRIREYHIESYWAAEAVRREKRAEFKEKALDRIPLVALLALEAVIAYGIINLAFGVI
jgi:hypothetical protein